MKHAGYLIIAVSMLALIAANASASYSITNLNTTIYLYANTSSHVTEVFNVSVTNSSVGQYIADRVALNLTISNWQSIIGSGLEQHIINPGKGTDDFKFLPGPLEHGSSGAYANLLLSYEIENVTLVNRTGPRLLTYTFNPAVFNFQHVISGTILPLNTQLNIIMPSGASVQSVYPIPDSPSASFANNYRNVTELTWNAGEPLSKFTLDFQLTESLQQEVQTFANQTYKQLGIFLYVIIAAVILLFILYSYLKTG